VPKALSDLIAQAMSKSRDHRFTDARALRRALLAAAETAFARGGRIAASLPPEPVHARAGAARRGPPANPMQGSAWGDFEGLEAPRIRDDNPPPASALPSFAPPKQQRLVAHAGDAALELSSDRAPGPVQLLTLPEPVPAPTLGAARPSAARKPAAARPAATAPAAPRPASPARARFDADDDEPASALDAINEGRDAAALDLDHERIRSQSVAQPRKRERPPSPQRPRVVATRQAPQGSGSRLLAWLVPLALVGAIAYVVFEPEIREAIGAAPPAAPSAAQVEAIDMNEALPGARARREKPGQAAPHMRDVVF
jgi:hypothetical protein